MREGMGLVMAQVAMGPKACLHLEPSKLDESIYILWLNPDLPGVEANSVCFGTQAQLKWVAESLHKYHSLDLEMVE